jgi:methylmalonyl-CoA mutase
MKGEKEEKLLSEFKPATYDEWKKLAESSLKGKTIDQLSWKTYEDIETKPIYAKEDIKESENIIGSLPGFEPFLRGTGYLNKDWDILQNISEPEPENFNKILRQNLEKGQNAILLTSDEASSNGSNTDLWIPAFAGMTFRSSAPVGRNGTSLFCIDDFSAAFKNIEIENFPVYIKTKSSLTGIAAIFASYLKSSKADFSKQRGGFFYDPVLTLAEDGFYPVPMADAFDEIAQVINWAKGSIPRFSFVTVNGNLFNEAGGNAVQEVAFSLGTAVEYLRELIKRAIKIDEIAPRIRFSFAIGPNFFIEIAKLRAARVLWSKVVKEFGGNENSMKLSIQAESCKWNKSKSEPYLNILRATSEAMSAIMGGCDSLSVGFFDEVLGEPGELSKRIARNTQIILKEECEIFAPADPAGGSWYVENLTIELAKKAWDLFRNVEKEGGMLKALEKGLPQKLLEEVRIKREEAFRDGKDVLVGVNKYRNSSKNPIKTPEIDYKAVFDRRHTFQEAYLKKRNSKKAKRLIEILKDTIKSDTKNIFNAAVEAVSAGATLGEISEALRMNKKGVSIKNPLKPVNLTEKF